MKFKRILLLSILCTFPFPALAKVGLSAGIGGIRATAVDTRSGMEMGATLSLESWGAGIVSAGPDLRVATGFTADDRFSYASAGARLNVDFLLHLSAAIRFGGAHFDGLLVPTPHAAGRERELVAPVVESEVLLALPLGPLLPGIRWGQGRVIIPKDPDFKWDAFSLVVGLRL